MGKLKGLIVDDSLLTHHLIKKNFIGDPQLEISSCVFSGRQALDRIKGKEQYDFVILDIEMPELNGIETLKLIRQSAPTLPVVMFSNFSNITQHNATFNILDIAKTDYAYKPGKMYNEQLSVEKSFSQLKKKIRILCHIKPDKTQVTPAPLTALGNAELILIGSSTGGPQALKSVFTDLPSNLPPILMVQHMPKNFTKDLAKILDSASAVKVHEATPGQVIEPGNAYIAPGDYHMILDPETRDPMRIKLNKDPQVKSCRPSVDVLFQSVAAVFDRKILAVVLTGMGDDGLDGCRLLKEKNANIIVQDEQTSVVWGMPGAVMNAGLAKYCLPLESIGEAIKKGARI